MTWVRWLLVAGLSWLVSLASPLEGEWTVESVTDPATEVEVRAAVGRGEDGFTLALFREGEGGRVVGLVRMPPGRTDFLAPDRPLVFVLDGGVPQEAVLLAGELKWQRFAVWHGRGEPLSGLLRDWMEGESLVARYQLYGGGYKEDRFSLDGARPAIAEALTVRGDVSPEELAAARRLEEARANELERCLALTKKKEQERCLSDLASCGDEATTDEELRACLATADQRVRR